MRNIHDPFHHGGGLLTRRRFVQGVAVSGAFTTLGIGVSTNSLAAVSKQRQLQMQTLSGKTFNLTIGEQRVNFTGSPRIATTVNGSLPPPLLRWKEGDTITLRVTNKLAESTSIHWHGIILPSAMDGVPNVANNFKGIAPGKPLPTSSKSDRAEPTGITATPDSRSRPASTVPSSSSRKNATLSAMTGITW